MHFIFPTHPLRSTAVEEMFADQLKAVEAAGYSASLCADSVIHENKPLRNVPTGATVVYRGWMLNAKEYARLIQAIGDAAAVPLTSTDSYLAAHHLPHWYPLLAEFTPETRVLASDAQWESELRSLGWDAFFIKDYVKSLKTSRGSIVRDPSEIGAVVAEMKQFRGEIEGGLCVRRVEPFITDSERRYFVLDGKAFSPNGQPVPDLVQRRVTHPVAFLLGRCHPARRWHAEGRRGWRRAGIRLGRMDGHRVRCDVGGGPACEMTRHCIGPPRGQAAIQSERAAQCAGGKWWRAGSRRR